MRACCLRVLGGIVVSLVWFREVKVVPYSYATVSRTIRDVTWVESKGHVRLSDNSSQCRELLVSIPQ